MMIIMLNRFLNVVLREDPLDSPFVPREKRWIAAVITAAAATVGSIINYVSNESTNNKNQELNDANIKLGRETNSQNAQLQRETNEQNYKIFQEQNAFNLDMWNKENQYNSPAQQVQRMLAAGINPAMNFGKTTDASSLTSAQASPMQASQMQAPKNTFEMRPTDFSGISDSGIAAVNAYNASRMMQSETKNKDALTANTVFDTTSKQKSLQDNLRYLRNIANGSGWQAEMARKQLEFYEATMDYDIQMKYGDTLMQKRSYENLEKQMRYQDLQNSILEITRGYAHQMNQAQISQLWSTVHQANAQIGLINANTMLTQAERENRIQDTVGKIFDNGMKSVDYNIKKATKQAVIQSYSNTANKGMAEAFNAWKYGPNGNQRTPSEIFQMDNLPDFMKRQFARKGYVPKF